MASNPTPVIFKARGMTADVQITVFDTVFYVHSQILKLHSHFFFTFFDSADKKVTKRAAGGQSDTTFKYEWVTKIVDNGEDWQLVSKGANVGDIDLSTYKEKDSIPQKTQAFKKLLYAFYNRLYEIDDIDELSEMTNLARFYVALPTLSKSLYAALYQSPMVIRDILDEACIVLELAAELRHPQLFRDALIFSLGPWDEPQYSNYLLPQKLEKIAKNAYNELCAKIVSVQQSLLIELRPRLKQEIKGIDLRNKIESLISRSVGETYDPKDGEICLPSFYRKLYQAESSHHVERALRKHIEPLMKNELILERDGNADLSKLWFLCVTIADEDLPWDTTETDW